MTTILITQPAVPADITAEQVVAYLLRPESGWREIIWNGSRRFVHDGAQISIALSRVLDLTIEDIARAESRPAIDVLADILGPVAGTVGVGCEPVSVRPRPIAKLRCFWRLQREREGVEDAKRKARVAPFYHEGEAPSAPKE